MTLSLADDVRAITRPRTVPVHALSVQQRSAALDAALAQAEAVLRGSDQVRDAAMARTRALYRAFGVDPTRTRPSSEALLRRVRKGERLPVINNLVDIVNWCSVESQVPFGLYDLQRIDAHVTARLGTSGEGYEGIRKDWVNVSGRLVVADSRGAFGNPTSDSARAMVTADTTDVVVVLFFPARASDAEADGVCAMTAERFATYAGGDARRGPDMAAPHTTSPVL